MRDLSDQSDDRLAKQSLKFTKLKSIFAKIELESSDIYAKSVMFVINLHIFILPNINIFFCYINKSFSARLGISNCQPVIHRYTCISINTDFLHIKINKNNSKI